MSEVKSVADDHDSTRVHGARANNIRGKSSARLPVPRPSVGHACRPTSAAENALGHDSRRQSRRLKLNVSPRTPPSQRS
jgi:hypothetical protein